MLELVFNKNLKDNIDEFKKEGQVTETESEKNGFLTKTVEFISNKGNIRIKQSTTERIKSKEEKELNFLWRDYFVLQGQKEEFVKKEDYYEAAKVKEKQETILNKIKQVKDEFNTRTIK